VTESIQTTVLLSLVASLFFGLQAVLAKRSLATLNAQAGAMITIVTATVGFWVVAPWLMESRHWSSPGLWVFVVNGFIHPTMSMYLSFEANRRMGATISATIAATAPLFAATGAVLALGETLTSTILMGTLGIVAGIIFLTWKRQDTYVWAITALFFPLGAAMVRAFNHVFAKYGLEMLDSGYFAATISFSTSAVVSVLAYFWVTRGKSIRLPHSGITWAGMGGVTIFISIFAMYRALATGQVVIVSPVVNTYPLFTLAWALTFRQETLRVKTLAGVVLVVAGVVLVSSG